MLRHALGDASEALARSSVARAVAFAFLRLMLSRGMRRQVFVDALPGALHTRERATSSVLLEEERRMF